MTKYYVRSGDNQVVLMAANSAHACILAFKSFYSKKKGQVTVASAFVVSERGFDTHHDDIMYPTAEILRLVQLSNHGQIKATDDLTQLPLGDYPHEDFNRDE